MKRYFTTALIAIFIAGCSTPQKPGTSKRDSFEPDLLVQKPVVDLPLRTDHTLMWQVQAEVNGVTGWFAVDTGSDKTILSPQFARSVEELNTRKPSSGTRSNFTHSISVSHIAFLRLDKILYLDFFAPVVNLDHINRGRKNPIDGILGCNVLSKTACTFDWKKNQLELNAGALTEPVEIISVAVKNHHLYATAVVNQTPVEFIVDTGSFGSSLSTNEIPFFKIKPEKFRQFDAPQIDIATNKMTRQTEMTLADFRLGKIARTEFPIRASDKNILGMDLLQPWIVTIDAAHNWMTLTKQPETADQ